MENILHELKKDKNKTIQLLKSKGKDRVVIEEIIKEFYANDRSIRDTQVENIQEDKIVDGKPIPQVRLTIPFQKKIVANSTAFEVGKPVTLTPNAEANESAKELFKSIWKINRIDDLIQKLVYQKKAQTESALLFYITDIKETSTLKKLYQKIGFSSTEKQMKIRLLDNRKGTMYPYFDDLGDMKAFTWEFKTKEADKDVLNTWIYDKKNVYKLKDNDDEINLDPHGFDRIPVVYTSQENTEYEDAKVLIDRYEVALSKLSGSNDYTAHPMLKIFGEVTNAPNKDENGKAWLIPITHDDEGKEVKGDVQLITNPNSSESTELELDKIENLIWSICSVVNLSFNNVKGLGDISGIALTLMFLDSNIKASLNEGDNRTMIERIINIIISGITTTTNIKLKKEMLNLYFDVEFNSILPTDLKEAVDTISTAVSSGVMSKRTAVEYLDMNQDTKEELELIKQDQNDLIKPINEKDKTNN